MPHIPRFLRALILCASCLFWLVPYVLSCLPCLLSHVFLCFKYLVSYVLSCLVPYMLSCLTCLVPYVSPCFACLSSYASRASWSTWFRFSLFKQPRYSRATLVAFTLSVSCPISLIHLMPSSSCVSHLLSFSCFSYLRFFQSLPWLTIVICNFYKREAIVF